MKSWSGTFNWYGEVHELTTKAVTEAKAKCNMLYQLAEKVKQPLGIVRAYYKQHQIGMDVKETAR